MQSNIGKKLQTLRKGRGMSQQQLSEVLGVSRCSISNYECMRRQPSLPEMQRIAEYFGVGLDYFGVETRDESFELLSRAKSIFTNKDIPKEERERLYKEIMKMYLTIE